MAKSSNLLKKFAMFFVAAAFAAMLVPGLAFADQSINVRWTDANGEHVESVNLTALAQDSGSTTKYGTLFNKSGYRVVGTDNSIALSDVLADAVYTDEDDAPHAASDVWTSGKSLTIKTTDYPNGYDKWTGSFSYENLNSYKNFYGDTTETTLGTTVSASYPARIALSHGTTALSGTTTAAAALSSMTCSTNSVRLIWGYLDSSNEGGNRFPDNITEIAIS